MDNTACKWIAIVGIILACLVGLWILGSIFQCLFYGMSCAAALCCLCTSCAACCCSSAARKEKNKSGYRDSQASYAPQPAYNPGPMPPPGVNNYYVSHTYQQQPEPAAPQVTPAWETYNKDGTTSITTVPPPQPSVQSGGMFSGLTGATGYQRLDENTSYGGGGNQGGAIEMNSYPHGENASYYNSSSHHSDMGNASHYYENTSAARPYGSQEPPPYK